MSSSPDLTHRCGFIALVGRPNVGKSTLLNTLIGAPIAIVSPKPQTTRTRITGIKTQSNAQLIFVDTPGIHGGQQSLLNRHMVDTAVRALQETDVTLFLLDAAHGLTPADAQIAQRLTQLKTQVLVGLNKIDLVQKRTLLPLLEQVGRLLPERDVIPISALKGENTAELMSTLLAVLPPGPALYPDDNITDQSERVLAQEMVREQLFFHTQQEIPYRTAVIVEQFQELAEKPLLRIYATIYVERPSQKAIVIGQKGARLKKIGQAARQRMEAFFGCRVYLELFVKVSKGWTNSPGMLRELELLR
ncbi:MAG: GTPase Era [Desulfurellaceae bacterium]|nr:GTPase Era [Desulfurellaceae bacterium]